MCHNTVSIFWSLNYDVFWNVAIMLVIRRMFWYFWIWMDWYVLNVNRCCDGVNFNLCGFIMYIADWKIKRLYDIWIERLCWIMGRRKNGGKGWSIRHWATKITNSSLSLVREIVILSIVLVTYIKLLLQKLNEKNLYTSLYLVTTFHIVSHF